MQAVLKGKGNNTQLKVLQTERYQNVTNKNLTLYVDIDGLLVCGCWKENGGSLYCYAKKVSGSVELTLLDEMTEAYGNAAKGGMSVYRIKGSKGAVINTYANTSKGATSASQNTATIAYFLG